MFKTNLKLTNLNNNLTTKKTKDQTSESSLLIKEGYITKLKSKKRRYFVLYADSDNESARLDYYENEKKFKTSPTSFKRSILLKDCFGVIKKHDPRFKKNNQFVFAIYTRDDCFSLLFDNEEEMNNWFSFINEIHFKSIAKSNMIHDYDRIWFVIINDKKSKITGSFYFCLTDEEIHLFKINNSKENRKSLNSSSSIDKTDQQSNKTKLNSQSSIDDQNESTLTAIPSLIKTTNHYNKPLDKIKSFRFPFSLIREFGHQSNRIYIELGRSSDLGSCKLWFELKDCDTSQYIHSLVASTRTTSKNNKFRTRSNSENNRMFARQNKSSISDKQNINSISQSNTTTSINQQLNKLSSNSLKINNQKVINCDKFRNEKDNSTECVSSSFFPYSPVNLLNNYQIRSRSTSESSSSRTASIAQNIFKIRNSQSSNQVSPSSKILSNESIQSIEEDNSDYYMATPGQRDLIARSLPAACIKEEDYLVVGDEQELIDNIPNDDQQFKNHSSIELNDKLDSLKSADLQLVSTTNARSYTLENAQYFKQTQNPQCYQPVNSSFVDLQNPVEELNEMDEYLQVVDEYLQVEFNNTNKEITDQKSSSSSTNTIKIDKDLKSTEINDNSLKSKSILKPLNESIRINNNQLSLEEEDDYIGIESFSSTNTATNQESENFENSNLSPISSTSCNINRVKTFSTSSNNTSNNELNSLGTSPSLLSNAFYNTINHKEDAHNKLDNVKSYFNSTEDCDYIKPARTYSMGTRDRPQLTSHKIKHSHGPTMSNSLILNKKVQCAHFSNDPNCNHHLDESTFLKDNRVRAYSMGSHSTVRKDLLKKIRLNQKRQENTIIKQNTFENGEMNDVKCLSTPILINKDYTRNRSATFTSSIPYSSRTSSKKTVNEESSEDDLMTVEFGAQSDDLSKSVTRFENEFIGNNFNQMLIKDKLKELSLVDAVESKIEAKD